MYIYINIDIYICNYMLYIYIYIYIFNAYSFDLLSSNNFLKWVKFVYEGNMCT